MYVVEGIDMECSCWPIQQGNLENNQVSVYSSSIFSIEYLEQIVLPSEVTEPIITFCSLFSLQIAYCRQNSSAAELYSSKLLDCINLHNFRLNFDRQTTLDAVITLKLYI